MGMMGALLSWAGEAQGQILRVGITPDYPPLVFREPDRTNGFEIDMAKALAAELIRPVEFVVLKFDDLIPALVDRRIDIIMSGMSITKARQLRIAFSKPYLHNELRAIFRQKDASRFKAPADVLNMNGKIGVIPHTTGDVFVSENCPNAQRVPIANRKDVAPLLIRGERMDVFVDDIYALATIISEHDAELSYLKQPLSEDDIAWGVRPNDHELLDAVNTALAKWKADGTLQNTLDRWIPYLKNLKSN
jgi:ABC-type amino acid transport substrate-binding protein